MSAKPINSNEELPTAGPLLIPIVICFLLPARRVCPDTGNNQPLPWRAIHVKVQLGVRPRGNTILRRWTSSAGQEPHQYTRHGASARFQAFGEEKCRRPCVE